MRILIPFVGLHKFLLGGGTFAAKDLVSVRKAAEPVDDVFVINCIFEQVFAPYLFEKAQRFFLDLARLAVLERQIYEHPLVF
jgi:hypothetical protein